MQGVYVDVSRASFRQPAFIRRPHAVFVETGHAQSEERDGCTPKLGLRLRLPRADRARSIARRTRETMRAPQTAGDRQTVGQPTRLYTTRAYGILSEVSGGPSALLLLLLLLLLLPPLPLLLLCNGIQRKSYLPAPDFVPSKS